MEATATAEQAAAETERNKHRAALLAGVEAVAKYRVQRQRCSNVEKSSRGAEAIQLSDSHSAIDAQRAELRDADAYTSTLRATLPEHDCRSGLAMLDFSLDPLDARKSQAPLDSGLQAEFPGGKWWTT